MNSKNEISISHTILKLSPRTLLVLHTAQHRTWVLFVETNFNLRATHTINVYVRKWMFEINT